MAILEATNELKESAQYELLQLTQQRPALFEQTVTQQSEAIGRELADLQRQADELAEQIQELNTGTPAGIA